MNLKVEELEPRIVNDITPITPSLPLISMVGVQQYDYNYPITPLNTVPVPLTPLDLVRLQIQINPIQIIVTPQLNLNLPGK